MIVVILDDDESSLFIADPLYRKRLQMSLDIVDAMFQGERRIQYGPIDTELNQQFADAVQGDFERALALHNLVIQNPTG